MPGLRVNRREQIEEWLATAKRITEKISPPPDVYREVFNAALNLARTGERVMTEDDFVASAVEALSIVASLKLPPEAREHAFHCAFTWTTEREVSVILEGVRGAGERSALH